MKTTKKWTAKSDAHFDKKHGIKDGSKRDNVLDKKRGLPVSKGYVPKTAAGKAAVKRLGRTKATGNFKKIASAAARKYGSVAAGKKVAGAIFWNKVKAHKK
jgi:heme oxygenase